MPPLLSYAGVPINLPLPSLTGWIDGNTPLMPDAYHAAPPSPWPGPKLFGLARPATLPHVQAGIGQHFYPTGASRWSTARFVADATATQTMAKAALGSGGATPQPFVCQSDTGFSFSTLLYLLPPRPLAVHGTQYPGLYLIELVDERYYWQFVDLNSFDVDSTSTWNSLLNALADVLDIDLTDDDVAISDKPAPTVYLAPEPDSHFWSNFENAAALLDAAAWNLGRVVVRSMDGSYEVQSVQRAASLVLANRGDNPERVAGGDLIGNLSGFSGSFAAQAILPQKVRVTFPKYITGGTPHYYNPRFLKTPRPTAWTEDSYGAVFFIETSLQQAGAPFSAFAGHPGAKTIRTTAKAWFDSESSKTPSNLADLQALATQLAKDYYGYQFLAGLDETYPGIDGWEPEAIHDILWTYRSGAASTRVFRPAWNYYPSEFQHSSGAAPGVGGKTVPLTVQGSGVQLPGINLITFAGGNVSQGQLTNGIAEAVVNLPATGKYIRIVGSGQPTTTTLAAAFNNGDTLLKPGPILGTITTLPQTPFTCRCEDEEFDVIDVTSAGWQTARWNMNDQPVPFPLGSEAYDHPAGAVVEVLYTIPYAFNEVVFAPGGVWADKEDGLVGSVAGAVVGPKAAALFMSILGDSAVSVDYDSDDNATYTLTTTSTPARDMNGQQVDDSGHLIASLLSPVTGFTTTLAGSVEKGSRIIALIDDPTQIRPGMQLTGPGFPAPAIVLAVIPESQLGSTNPNIQTEAGPKAQVLLDTPATETATEGSYTFVGQSSTTLAGLTVSGQNTISLDSGTTANLAVGMQVSGPGIVPGTTILRIVNDTLVQISIPATTPNATGQSPTSPLPIGVPADQVANAIAGLNAAEGDGSDVVKAATQPAEPAGPGNFTFTPSAKASGSSGGAGAILYYLFDPEWVPFWVELQQRFDSPVWSSLSADITAEDATMTIDDTTGFPRYAKFPVLIDEEIIIVGTISGDVVPASGNWLNITRGAYGTVATEHDAGSTVTLINPSYSWRAALRGDAAPFFPDPAGRNSGAIVVVGTDDNGVPIKAPTVPAYCSDPLANPMDSYFPFVLLYPRPAGLNGSGENFWVFEWIARPPYASISNGGLLNSSDQYVLGKHGFVEVWIGTYSPAEDFPTGLMGSLSVDTDGNLIVASSKGSISTGGSTPVTLKLAASGSALISRGATTGGGAVNLTVDGTIQSGTPGAFPSGNPGGYSVVDSSGTEHDGGTATGVAILVMSAGTQLQQQPSSFIGGLYISNGAPTTPATLGLSGGLIS